MEGRDNSHSGHRARLRQRFENEGLENFAPHEVLELLLFYSIPQRDTNELAHKLLQRFSSIDRVFDADIPSLTQVSGIGYNSAVLIHMISEITRVYIKSRYKKSVHIDNSEEMGEYMCSRIGMMDREVFAVAAFNAANEEIAFRIINEGIIGQAPVQMRTLVEFAINNRAETLVVAHNHVAGSPNPSHADREATRMICSGLLQIGVKVIDHIVVAGDRYYSFAMNDIMPV